ncbi:hypothetical protein AH04_176 [Erwinia phage AH04]|uniref:Uncharacterized protein n=1 Tax=Erwinia phage AH04 TaxID=2869569 RepID=A0AAE8BQD7_9CAUD|nr:hypothetical protein PQC02_gp138 [Erwinia phage AH04]QZA70651.1 hypothetical protein AH04_176 [Erwinia phage AH04]
MDSKTAEVNEILIELADRLGTLQLKLKEAEGEERERLMEIAHTVRKDLDTLI